MEELLVEDKSSIKSVDIIRVFAKAHPKVVKVEGGYMFEFIDVLSVSREQQVKTKNASPEDIKKAIESKDRMGLSGGKKDIQLEFPFDEEKGGK